MSGTVEPTIDDSTLAEIIAFWDRVEQWRDIVDFPGYSVSSWGRVKGVSGTVLKPNDRYPAVSFVRNGFTHRRTIHRLVAFAFLGQPPFPEAVVTHVDGNPQNPRISNLRWATPQENRDDRIRHETTYQGSQVYTAKLAETDIPEIRTLHAQGGTIRGIARRYKVSPLTIRNIVLRKAWKHVGEATDA